LEDKEMVAGLLKEEPAAQQHLDKAFRKRLYQTAVYFLGIQDPEIEDVVQESFVMALRDLAHFEFRSSFYTWINHICVNRCFQRLRERNRVVLGQEGNFDALLASQALHQHGSSDEAEIQEERRGILRRAMQRMNELCRGVLGLRVERGMSYAEIAKVLRVPMGTVMSRLARCQAQLNSLVTQARTAHE
jgi:RNA polymerase sigma-70 factor (ECF subfamily)